MSTRLVISFKGRKLGEYDTTKVVDHTSAAAVKDVIDWINGRLPLYNVLNWAPAPAELNGYVVGPEVRDSIRLLCSAGHVVQAIKLVRVLSGSGLKEAKDFVDDLRSPAPNKF